MSLASPKLLWLIGVVPLLVIAFALDGQRRQRVLERIGHLPMIAQMILSLSPVRRRLQSVCLVAAAGALALALAGPQAAGRARLNESRGLDLVVALDLSRSMLARDIYPSRLDRAKAEVSRLLDELKGDRVGLVAFAGETLSYPLTTDYEAAKLFWRDLEPSDMPVGGTDLGRAIGAAQELLDRSSARTAQGRRKPAQVILLITDGEDTEARGLDAAKRAAQHGIHIYAVAIGSGDRPFVPLTDENGKANGYLTGADGEPVRVGIDAEGLRKIAAVSAGEYFTMEPHQFGVERVQQAIASLERTEEEARLEREPEDIGRWFVLVAFVLLAGGAAIGDRKRRPPATIEDGPANEAAAPVMGRESTGSTRTAPRVPGAPRGAALVLLFAAFPFVTGFDLFQRADPDLEAGNKAMAAGKPEEALAAYDRAVAARPDDASAHFDRGSALMQLKRWPEATRELQRSLEGHEPAVKADAYYNLGLTQHQQEKFKEAIDAYKRALALRPDDRRTKWNLEVAQRRLKEQKEQKQQDQKNDPKQDQKQDQKQDAKQDQKTDPKQDQKQAEPKPEEAARKPEDKGASETAEKVRELEKQDAEAVLDALERVEPTVQKDIAKKRAGGRKAKRDW